MNSKRILKDWSRLPTWTFEVVFQIDFFLKELLIKMLLYNINSWPQKFLQIMWGRPRGWKFWGFITCFLSKTLLSNINKYRLTDHKTDLKRIWCCFPTQIFWGCLFLKQLLIKTLLSDQNQNYQNLIDQKQVIKLDEIKVIKFKVNKLVSVLFIWNKIFVSIGQ